MNRRMKGLLAAVLAAVIAGGAAMAWRTLPHPVARIAAYQKLDKCTSAVISSESAACAEETVGVGRTLLQPLLDALDDGKAQYQGKLDHYGVPAYSLTLSPSEHEGHDPNVVLDLEGDALYVLTRSGTAYEYWRLTELDHAAVQAALDELLA